MKLRYYRYLIWSMKMIKALKIVSVIFSLSFLLIRPTIAYEVNSYPNVMKELLHSGKSFGMLNGILPAEITIQNEEIDLESFQNLLKENHHAKNQNRVNIQ